MTLLESLSDPLTMSLKSMRPLYAEPSDVVNESLPAPAPHEAAVPKTPSALVSFSRVFEAMPSPFTDDVTVTSVPGTTQVELT